MSAPGSASRPISSVTGLRGGLGRNLLIVFLLLAIVPLGVNTWLVVNHTNQEMRQATQERLSAIATLKAVQIDHWLAIQEQRLTQVSVRLAAASATAVLFQSAPNTPAYAAAAEETRVILQTALAQYDGFRALRLERSATGNEVLLAVEAVAPATMPRGVCRTVPIPGPAGDSSGWLAGELDLAPLIRLVADTPTLNSAGRVYLVTPAGQTLGLDTHLTESVDSPGIAAALAGGQGSALYIDHAGQPVVGAYAWNDSLGLAIIVEQPQREAFAPADNLAALLIANTLVVALLTTLLAAVVIRRITRPIIRLTTRAVQIADGDFWQTVPVDRRDEIGILAQAFNVMATELCQFYDNLQSIVAERTRQLQEANRQLQHYTARLALSAEVGRVATAILDPDTLLEKVTQLIHDSYSLSYVGIGLLDETGQQVILRARAGNGIGDGAVPTRTPVGDETPIGRAAAAGEPCMVRLVPTHVELAIPLRSGQRNLGVLDLWADNPDAFSTSDIRVLQSLGDQISVAIVNAQTYAQERATVHKLRQLERLRMQSLGSMSHELATALNSIIGFSRLILKGVDGPLTDLQRTDLTAIHQSGHHLLSMLDNVLDLVELERGTLTLARERLDVNNLIEEVIASTAPAGAVNGQLVTRPGHLSPAQPIILGDGPRLRQVLIHLIAEAAESAETVVISTRTEGQQVLVYIAGQPDDAQPPIPVQAGAASDGVIWDTEGASLGVALSKRIVELHEGRMWTPPTTGRQRSYVLAFPAAEVLAVPASDMELN